MSCLYLEGVVVPHTVERGDTARLQCRYSTSKLNKYSLNTALNCLNTVYINIFRFDDRGHDSLYSLKWYKDEVEFYRCSYFFCFFSTSVLT